MAKKRKKRTDLERLTWKTLDSKKQEKFSKMNWKNSSWKKELEKKMNCPGVYCLHDDKRIFYIGISTDGVMKNRWDPTSDSSHDSGQRYQKKRKKAKKKKSEKKVRAGGKWSGQGKFASGKLVFKVKESSKVTPVSSKPKLSYHPFKKYNPKFVGRGKRRKKKWSKASQIQKQKIKFIEYMVIRRTALIHQFGGLKKGDRIASAKDHNAIKKGRDYVQNKTTLSTGWTLMNKKDGIPFHVKQNLIKQYNVSKGMNKLANKFRIKIICAGSRNPLHGTNRLFNKAVIIDEIIKNNMKKIKKIPGTISLINKSTTKKRLPSNKTTKKSPIKKGQKKRRTSPNRDSKEKQTPDYDSLEKAMNGRRRGRVTYWSKNRKKRESKTRTELNKIKKRKQKN